MFGTLPAYGFYCRHVEGLAFRNVELRTSRPDLRHAMVFDDVKQVEIDSLEADGVEGAAATLRFVQVDGAVIRRSTAPKAADRFLRLEGDRTREIVLEENDVARAAKAVEFGPGVSKQAVSSD